MDILTIFDKYGAPYLIIGALMLAIALLYKDNKELQRSYREDLKEISDKYAGPIAEIRRMVEAIFNKGAG